MSGPDAPSARVQDRCRGAMIGLAAGNLLGVPAEGWPRGAIRRRYPDGVREIETGPEQPDDDDLAQALILAAACLEGESLDAEDLGRRFWEWAEENGLGIGLLTADVLRRYGGAAPRVGQGRGVTAREPAGCSALEAARTAWEESGRQAAGNGAVMRCAPLAIRWMDDDTALVRNTVVSAGGDTDTNGAVAGAVLGARFGCRAIPPRWRGAVARLRPGRQPMETWADRLLELTRRAPGERH